ncbi:MAG: hypothetical protein GOVbin4162_92 [Prokaryotic dsDNA virus sp.]|nr:MAG: hypothetical protein GOVbin4162_92 [Prokaryotic dsDNA virus sp.]
MQQLVIKNHVFTPTEVIEDRKSFYLASGYMEVDGVDESCVVCKDRDGYWDIFFKHSCVELEEVEDG